MNAPATTITKPKPRPVSAQYAPTVERMLPGCAGRELELRCSILYMRDHATACLRGPGDDAGDILELIERMATRHAFASMPLDTLETIQHSLVRMVCVATDVRQAFSGGGDG